jgi:hypothetical protein
MYAMPDLCRLSLLGKQCIAIHIYYLASNAYLYDLVLGKQGLPIQVLQIGKQGPDSCLLLFKQCTYPDLRQFLHQARWEHIPNPEITLRVSCAFFQKR